MKTSCLFPIRWLGAAASVFAGVGVHAAPLTWFPGPSLFEPISGGAAVVSPGLGNVIIGGTATFYPAGESGPEYLNATNLSWSGLPIMSSVNISGGAVASGDYIIVYGGTDGASNVTSTAFGYSPSGDAVQPYPSMSVARAFFGYAPDRNGSAYAIGGLDSNYQPLASAEALSADTSTWSAIASLPAARYSFPAVSDGTNSIYIFGGYTDVVSGVETADVLRYSVNRNTWTNLAAMPVPVAASAAALGADGKIYVVGGVTGGLTTGMVQVYDPAANSWAASTPLPEALSASAMSVDSLGRLVVIGGADTNGNAVSDVWRSQRLGVPDSAPVLTSHPTTNATYLGAYSSSIAATGNPPPVYLLINGPTNMAVDYFSGAVTWTPQSLDQIGGIPVTIRATNYAGFVDWSFTITVPNPPPALPTNIHVVSVTENSATVAWDPESPAFGLVTFGLFIPHPYHSPRGSGGGVNYQPIGSTTSNTFTITGLAPNGSYGYDLKATGPSGSSGYAGFSVTTLGPQPPSNLKVTGVTSTSISLAWDPSPGPIAIARYEILGWVGGLLPTIGYGANYTATAATITGLHPGTYEEWTVRGYDAGGNVSGFSAGVYAVNPVPAPATLSAPAPAPGGGFQLTVSEGGTSLQTVLIEATTDPADPNAWVQIGSVLPGANPFSFTDTNAAEYPMRFYRVVSP
jgi:hypothetical protein